MPITSIDQLNNTISLDSFPKRIVSLVPSQTELLYHLRLDEEVIGITKFCVHPKHWYQSKQKIGGTKTVNIEKIKKLQPDLIIANKEENVKSQVEDLQKIFPTWISDIYTLADALEMNARLGLLLNKEDLAYELNEKIKTGFEQLPKLPKKIKTAYLIWKDPLIAAGDDTFINNMLSACSFDNIFNNHQRYPEVSIEELKLMQCELVILSSEPYPFKQKHVEELKQQMPGTRIVLADGEMFSWYGSRLQFAPKYFSDMITEITASFKENN
jgi:ABC-type Fe3+-hydroxamate transport system substrate-binding protein